MCKILDKCHLFETESISIISVIDAVFDNICYRNLNSPLIELESTSLSRIPRPYSIIIVIESTIYNLTERANIVKFSLVYQ